MKAKYRASAVAGRFGRLTFLITCAIFLTTFRSTPPPAHAQSDEPMPGAVTLTQTFNSMTAPETITHTFTNPGSITIPTFGAATPYPSQITVSNIPIQLAKVTVKFNSMSHTFPSDLDILLVGPQGQTAVVMSDVGGGTDMVNVNLTLDDAATAPMTSAAIVTGTYIPTNIGTGDIFPAPAPAASSSSALSVFNGTNPNGTWRLFVVDNVGVDAGSIAGGWTLDLTAAISGQNTSAITIPDNGAASPYPSEILITNHNDPVSRVLVTLTNFGHSSPDDVDVMLVSPSGRAVVLMSDAGGANAASNLNLSFEDTALNALPDSGALASGTYRPTDFEPGDAFPAPAPSGGPMGRMLSSLHGTVANGTWKLFVVDDSGNNVGNISGGWNILIGTTAGAVNIEGSGVANPYPSEFTVSGLPGSITRATATLSNFSHLAADDVDILLVGPSGRRIVLMSDAGGLTEVGGLNLTFDDAAPSAIPDAGPLSSGTYRPADYEPGEVFPAPAPSGAPTGSTLNAFYGSAPNGIWRLYVVNENGASYGSIAGNFNVILQTSTSACLVTINPLVQAFPVGGGNGSFDITQPVGCEWVATTTDSFISLTSPGTGAGNGSISFTVAANQGPPRTGTIDVSNGVQTRSFQVQQPSGCPFSLSQSTMNFAAPGGIGNVNVSAGGGCSWQGSTLASWIQITSAPQSGDGTLVFSVQPNTTGSARSATINVGGLVVNVNQAPLKSARFDFDGDSRTDISVFRPSTGTWWIAPSGQPNTATAQNFGISTDRIAPADFDGDLKTDIAVYRDGTWYFVRSSNGTVGINSWGTTGDVPVPGDYDSDGSAELAVYRPSTGVWWILNSNGTFSSVGFGLSGDIATPGDYDGDGRTDLSVYRGASAPGGQGTWWIFNSSNNSISQTPFGTQGDVPVPADYDGDGRDNAALFRPSTGIWYRSTNAATNYDAVQWGISTDRLAPGDYDGDGKAEPAVVRFGTSAVWYVLGSTSGVQISQFGNPGDQPAPSAYVP